MKQELRYWKEENPPEVQVIIKYLLKPTDVCKYNPVAIWLQVSQLLYSSDTDSDKKKNYYKTLN